MLDEMPSGWRESIGEQLCEELKMVLVKEGLLEKYRVHQIKEKFGSLRWYGNFENDSIDKILEKYEEKSKYTYGKKQFKNEEIITDCINGSFMFCFIYIHSN